MLLTANALPAVGTIMDVINAESNTFTIINGKRVAIAENGNILDQDLDEDGQGYTVMHVWGSHYEMGYAYAELLDQYIVTGINEIKSYLGEDYNLTRDIIADSVWMPSEIEDEIDGMVDSLTITYPSENIDELDIKVINTLGDWNYACRSHSCWGRYVAEPIKTLSTRRLDYPEFPFTQASHHVLCAREPDDGSVQWVNLGPPGYVTSITGVNEFGTLVSSHDYQSYNSDTSPGRMPRMVAFRHAMTYATDTDVSTHINTTFNELQNYEIMTGTFLNYYAPEGNGGVMTANPHASGPDFWHLRRPNESWHHGEAMITTNAWTDGSYTPSDENFGADVYYDDETPKTQESHWDLLRTYSPSMNMHMLSVAYRGRGGMTIWADGRLPGGGHTPRMEYEWYELFENMNKVVTGSGPAYNNAPSVRVFPASDSATHDYEFDAYGAPHFGVNVTCGEVTGDGFDKILTGPGPGAIFGPHVRGFEVDGTPLPGLSFIAYGTRKWGANAACGDIDDDGFDEIITGPGPGAVFGPHVRAFDYDGTPSITPVPGVSFFAYGTRKWGVNVSGGDIDSDGFDEIITGPGPGAVFGPHVRGWNVDGGPATAIPAVSFIAYGTRKFGVRVAYGQLDGDVFDEIVTAPGPSSFFGSHIRGWNYDNDSISALPGCSFFAWPSAEARYGAQVYAGGDLDLDCSCELSN